MSVLESLFGLVRQREQEQHRTKYDRLRDAVIADIEGEALDPSELLALLDELGLKPEDFQTEREAILKRMESRSQMESARAASIEAERLQREFDDAKREHDDMVTRSGNALMELAQRLRNAEIRAEMAGRSERELLTSVRDPELLERKRTLDLRRAQLGEQRALLQRITSVHSGRNERSIPNEIKYAKIRLAEMENMARYKLTEYQQREFDGLKKHIPQLEHELDAAKEELRMVESQMRKLDDEGDELTVLMLEP